MMTLGKMLKAYRDKFDLSQEKIAEEVGTSKPTVSRLENGKDISAKVFARLLLWMIGEER